MEKRFIQPVIMEVTVEQYEKDLKDHLENLGYSWDGRYNYGKTEAWLYFLKSTNHAYITVVTVLSECKEEAYLIKEYNPELFLAIAAMTEGDLPIVGEYMMRIADGNPISYPNRQKGDLVKVSDFNYYGYSIIVPDKKSSPFNKNYNRNIYRKATLEELVSHFSKRHAWLEELVSHFSKQSEKSKTMKFPIRISPEQQRTLIDACCQGHAWQNKLIDLFAKSMYREETHPITESFYKEMREAAEGRSRETKALDEVFGKEKPEVNVRVGQVWRRRGIDYIVNGGVKEYRLVSLTNSSNGWSFCYFNDINDIFNGNKEEFEYIGLFEDVYRLKLILS